jgi:hypothetical protein
MRPRRHRTRTARAILAGSLVLLANLALGSGTASGAPPAPLSVSPTSLSMSADVNGFDFEFVTITTKKKIALENPASFGAGSPFFDPQTGTCWQQYGALGLRIPPKTTCTIQVGFHPSTAGSFTDVMTVYACSAWHINVGGQLICDAHDGSATVALNGTATTPSCTYTAGTSGCIVLTNVEITDSSSTATYTLNGGLTFTPTCQNGVGGCIHDYPYIVITGSGTFSVTGSQSASGTWTVPAWPNDRPNPSPYQFTDADGVATTCALAQIRQITANLPLTANGGATGGGYLSIRQDTTSNIPNTSRVSGVFSTPTLPSGTFNNPPGSMTGVTILC